MGKPTPQVVMIKALRYSCESGTYQNIEWDPVLHRTSEAFDRAVKEAQQEKLTIEGWECFTAAIEIMNDIEFLGCIFQLQTVPSSGYGVDHGTIECIQRFHDPTGEMIAAVTKFSDDSNTNNGIELNLPMFSDSAINPDVQLTVQLKPRPNSPSGTYNVSVLHDQGPGSTVGTANEFDSLATILETVLDFAATVPVRRGDDCVRRHVLPIVKDAEKVFRDKYPAQWHAWLVFNNGRCAACAASHISFDMNEALTDTMGDMNSALNMTSRDAATLSGMIADGTISVYPKFGESYPKARALTADEIKRIHMTLSNGASLPWSNPGHDVVDDIRSTIENIRKGIQS